MNNIQSLINAGLALCHIPPGEKKPVYDGWQQNPIKKYDGRSNVGLIHGTKTVAVDIDNYDQAKVCFAAIGIDMESLLDSLPRVFGNPDRAKVIFRLPEDANVQKKNFGWPKKEGKGVANIFELRTGSHQDVIHGSHPDGHTYRVEGDLLNIPMIPDQLLFVWQHWPEAEKEMLKACPWYVAPQEKPKVTRPNSTENGASVIDAFNERFNPFDLLIEQGYTLHNGRLLSPNSSTKIPAVKMMSDGKHFYSFHGSCPFGDMLPHDAFDVFTYYMANGDRSSAVKMAAEMLGMNKPKNQNNGKPNSEPKENALAGDPVEEVAPKFLQTETGLADRLIYHHGKDLKHNFAHSWLLWDGKRWQPGAEKEVQEFAKETVKGLFSEVLELSALAHEYDTKAINAEAEGQNSKSWKELAATITTEAKVLRLYAKSMNKHSAIRAALSLAHSDPAVSVDPEDFDQADWLLNVHNGTIDLQTGKLSKHSRDNLLTKVLPIEYKEMDTPVWDQFLKDIFNNDQDLIDYIYRALGYSLTGSNREQCLFICYGSGCNGKSVFMTAVQNILGSYAIETHPETIMMSGRNNPGQASEGTARLAGARFVSVNEIEQGQRFDEAKIKSLTGGDRIIARNLYKSSFEFFMKGKIWMRTNYKPEFRGVDEGITRRMTEIPFTVTIPAEKKDLNLSEKLRKEYPGILAKMVHGCLEWQKNGLAAPDRVKEATREYLAEQDFMGAFLDEIMPEGLEEIKASDMFSQYERWAAETGRPAMTQTRFGKLLNQKGWSTRKSNGNILRVPPVQGQSGTVGIVENAFSKLSPDLEPSEFKDILGIDGDSSPASSSIAPHFLLHKSYNPSIPTVPKEEKEVYKNSSITGFDSLGRVYNEENTKNAESLSVNQKQTGIDAGMVEGQLFDDVQFAQAIDFVTQMFNDQRQFELMQICKTVGLGDRWPAVRLIQAKDFTKDNWAIRVWLAHEEAA
jgi:P4 family phage/plasmid primase-like protien